MKQSFYTIILTAWCFLSFRADAQTYEGLIDLPGYRQQVYYSPGNEARAREIAQRSNNATIYFESMLGFKPATKLFILAPQHWKEFATFPVYGMPHNLDSFRLAIATDENDFWRSFLPPVDGIPAQLAAQVKKAYGKPDSTYSMMPFFDLLALHELGHPYHEQGGLKMQRKWMQELFVNIMLHTYVAEKEPQLLPALETFPSMVVGAGTAEYKFTSLADFERLYEGLGMGPKNYGWYQSKLHVAAKNIYNAGGPGVMKKLWVALKKHQEKIDNNEFVKMLKKEVHPSVANAYLKWNKP
jgi:hypothetical protein